MSHPRPLNGRGRLVQLRVGSIFGAHLANVWAGGRPRGLLRAQTTRCPRAQADLRVWRSARPPNGRRSHDGAQPRWWLEAKSTERRNRRACSGSEAVSLDRVAPLGTLDECCRQNTRHTCSDAAYVGAQSAARQHIAPRRNSAWMQLWVVNLGPWSIGLPPHRLKTISETSREVSARHSP